jgi:hypothetical protein
MDSESLLFPNCEFQPQTWPLDRIALFSSGEGARTFLAEVFPHFCHCLVVSADGAFPQNPALREAALQALSSDPHVKVLVFGLSALKAVPVLSERLLLMDDLVMQDFRRHGEDRKQGLALTVEKLVFLARSFFLQWEKMARIGNPAFSYRHFAEFDEQRFDWKAQLLWDEASLGKENHDPTGLEARA